MSNSQDDLSQEKQRHRKLKKYENRAYREGFRRIAGIDEVGRGPIAGPVVAAAVILPRNFFLPGVNDSKLVSPSRRQEMAAEIKQKAIAWTVVSVSSRQIDQKNILQCTREAMCICVEELIPRPDFLLIDAVSLPHLEIEQYPIIKGDSLSISIACASILAKVERDAMMASYDQLFPGYGFKHHKGYATREHCMALESMGPCAIHRGSFEPVRSLFGIQDWIQPGLFDT
ncbi:MAG TPA: ribonuclease HII [Syntrophomonadaceae bacterium]|jgi:ribonuclease HII|nr:ribonuclease HII [Syntrophomonadaceae bacterium]